jgi:hypothetical protein
MSHVLILKKQADGSLCRARPAFMLQHARSPKKKTLLPEGYQVAGSPEHQAANRRTRKTGEGSLMAPFLQSGPKIGLVEKPAPLSLKGSCS